MYVPIDRLRQAAACRRSIAGSTWSVPRTPRSLPHAGGRWLTVSWSVHAVLRGQARHTQNQRRPHQRRRLPLPPDQTRFRAILRRHEQSLGRRFRRQGPDLIEACVIPHLWHMIRARTTCARAGSTTASSCMTISRRCRPPALGEGRQPLAANGKSDAAGGGHAHAGLMCYLGGSWPQEYVGSLFMNNIHGAPASTWTSRGPRFRLRRAPRQGFHPLQRPRQPDRQPPLRQDGSVYMIDWYDKNQCHSPNPAVHDRTTGRIFKVSTATRRRPKWITRS